MFALSLIILVAIVLQFFFRSRVLEIIITAACLGLYSMYLIYDTQLIIGGKSHELQIDDYILGALFLYIDII